MTEAFIGALVFAALILVPPIFGFGPPIYKSTTFAKNNLFGVWLPPDDVSVKQDNSPGGRRAQEISDWWNRLFVASIPSLGLVYALTTPEMSAVLGAALFGILLIVFHIWTTIFPKTSDLIGHEVEILWVEKYEPDQWDDYRKAEVDRLFTRDRKFNKMGREKVEKTMKRLRPWSKFLMFMLRRKMKYNYEYAV